MTFLRRLLNLLPALLLGLLALGSSSMPPGNQTERVRFFTRQIEFDYVQWTLDSLWLKLGQDALNTARYLPGSDRPQLVLDYIDVLGKIQTLQAKIRTIFSDPAITDPQSASASQRQELDRLTARRDLLQPVAESIVEAQVSQIAAEKGLGIAGQALPPVLFHITAPPYALIVSPRNAIRQDQDISILPDISIPDQVALEKNVDQALDVSSLVVGIGGVGLYPTMVMQTTSINWLAEVVAHEWTHNILTTHPLGASYELTPELRIMNETAASISGKEIGEEVIVRFYPAYVPPPPPAPENNQPQAAPQPPVSNFPTEMHTTRVEVDRLLGLGKIAEAESYMEARRRFLWDNGYQIRKINQAYFAFYGAYADQAVGAAGQDPVGAAVRALRSGSPNLAAFIYRIEWMWSYAQLQQAVSPKR